MHIFKDYTTGTKTKFGTTGPNKFNKQCNYDTNKYEVTGSINPAMTNYLATEFGINKSNSSKNISLKNKLLSIEDNIQETSKKMNQIKKETGLLKAEKDLLKESVKISKVEIKRYIAQEICRVDEEMKRHFAHQKAENSRLYQQLNQFKNDKSSYNSIIIEINKKIKDLELQIGFNS